MNTALTIPGFGLPAVSHCGVCGRTLTDPVSIAAGIGPVCAHKHGNEGGFEQRDELDPFDPETMDITTRRLADETPVFNIPQRHKHHSPTGMEFGYAGSGPADFALNILALFVAHGVYREPLDGKVRCWDGTIVSGIAWDLHQQFKADVIARLPREGGVITGDSIRAWFAAHTFEAVRS
ncbi:DUF6011 domain-containing protein [Mycolicibacterium sp.]|uniref:DUF6011 domain-containing protein n=1 Tax=Mycolicibacterium sp. TaxID=2320850 RepID=UPI00355E2A17